MGAEFQHDDTYPDAVIRRIEDILEQDRARRQCRKFLLFALFAFVVLILIIVMIAYATMALRFP